MDPLDWLIGLEILGMKFGLETMRALCATLEHPERAFPSVIVAGTNGKGSVTAMVSAALDAAAYRTGRYTSPHLHRLEERFTLSQQEVDTPELRAAAGRIRDAVESLQASGALAAPPTFFECTTAIAFDLFRRAGVEIAVLEVGLGGRLDATNVVTPIAAAITSIDLDHQAQLGGTLAEIAREKAGVIKPGIPVICGPLPGEAAAVIEEVRADRGARTLFVGRELIVDARPGPDSTIVTIRTPHRTLRDVPLALRGRHQADNAAVAVGLMDELGEAGFPVNDAPAAAGLATASWPARLERIRWGDADVLIDAAHNPAGARALAAYIAEFGWADAVLVFGAMRDKDARGMLLALAPRAAAVICTTAPGRRASPAAELAAIAREVSADAIEVQSIADPVEALACARARGRRIVITGSIFLLGALRGILR